MGMRRFFNGEHPVTAVIAVVAIVCAILLIMWARVEVHGTTDIEDALEAPISEKAHVDSRTHEQREVDAAVTSNRFITGFSP